MKYDDENWIKIFTRDTPGWLAISWQARGLALEIARKLPRTTGELSLGRRGLEALAPLLRAEWSAIEPFVRELIDEGRLVYDEARQTLSDPQHVERQASVSSDAARARAYREKRRDSWPPSRAVTERHEASRDVTKDNAPSRDITPASRDVTERHTSVTPRHHKKEEKDKKEEIENPPTPRPSGVVPTADSRIVGHDGAFGAVFDAWRRGVSSATGARVSQLSPLERRDLVDLINTHGNIGSPNIEAWVEATAAEFVRATEARFGYTTKRCKVWLDAGKPIGLDRPPPSHRRGAEVTRQPVADEQLERWIRDAEGGR